MLVDDVFFDAGRRSSRLDHFVSSLNYVSWKMSAEVAEDLKAIYSCATVEKAEQRLGAIEDKWDHAYPPIGQSRRRNWPRITPFFD